MAVQLVTATTVPPGRSTTAAGRRATRLEDSLRVLEVAAGVAVIALAIALPLALLAAAAAGGARLAGRRRRERALDVA